MINLIECEQIKNFNEIRADDEFCVKVNDCCDNGFSSISTQLFEDYICKLGHVGWSLYCMLYQYHNESFGNKQSWGFSTCSEEFMSNILNRNKNTISKYVNEFKDNYKKLIKVESQDPVLIYNSRTQKDEKQYMPNHYCVLAKCDYNNKYYVGNIKPLNATG
jgi:hypothetical protein